MRTSVHFLWSAALVLSITVISVNLTYSSIYAPTRPAPTIQDLLQQCRNSYESGGKFCMRVLDLANKETATCLKP